MRKVLTSLFLLAASIACAAQTQTNPTTQIAWPLITGAGTPTSFNLACTSEVGMTVNITTSGGVVTAATINAGGSGIVALPQTVQILGGGGTGAVLSITTASGGAATAITLVAGGTGYANTTGARVSLANYGQPYQNTAVNPNTTYTCGSDGWAQRGGSGSGCAEGTCIQNNPVGTQTETQPANTWHDLNAENIAFDTTTLPSTTVTPSGSLSPSSVAVLWPYEFVTVQGTAPSQISTYNISTGRQVVVGSPTTFSGCAFINGVATTNLSGTNILVATCNDNGTLYTFSISSAGALTAIGSVTGLTAASPGIVIHGSFVYVPLFGVSTSATGAVAKVSISASSAPTIVTTTTLATPSSGPQNPFSLAYSGGFIYAEAGHEPTATNDSTIQVLNATTMALVGSPFAVAHSPQKVFIQGHVLYVTFFDAQQVQAIDITNPASLVSLQILSLGSCNAIPVQPVAGDLYVGCFGGNKIILVDISNPSNMQILQTYTGFVNPESFAAAGRFLIAATGATAGSVYLADAGGIYAQRLTTTEAYIEEMAARSTSTEILSVKDDSHTGGTSFSNGFVDPLLTVAGCVTNTSAGVFGTAPCATGTVTSIATSGPISGGPITTTGTISCATCVTSAASLTNNQLIVGGGGQAAVSFAAGTNLMVLHGNASGLPSWSSVNLMTDVTSILPAAFGGTGLGMFSANTVLIGPTTGSAAVPTVRLLQGLDLPLATTSLFGAMKPDGTTITISAGVITAVAAGTGTVTHTAGALTATHCVTGNGAADITVDTVCTLDGSGNMVLASLTTSGSKNGALTLTFTGTGATAPSTNQFQISPAISVTTPWSLSPAAAPSSGYFKGTNTAGVVQQSFEASINLAADVGSSLLPHANIAATAVTPGSYTSANITVAADGSITAAANGSGGSMIWPTTPGITVCTGTPCTAWGTSIVAATVALLASPTFTGTPAAPTASPGTNTTQLATTAFVTAAVAAGGSFTPPSGTGFVKVSGGTLVTSAQLIGVSDIYPNSYVAGAGSVNVLTATLSPAATALTVGLQAWVLPNLANTSTTPTVNLNGLGAVTIMKSVNGTISALAANDYVTTLAAHFFYDGTEMILLNPQTASAGGGVSSVSGTTNQIVSTGGTTPVLSLSSTLALPGTLSSATAGAASTPAVLLSGALFTGGTGTTTFPLLDFDTTGSTARTSLSTSGTYIGINTASGFVGNFLDFRVNGGNAVLTLGSTGTLNTGAWGNNSGTASISATGRGTFATLFTTTQCSSVASPAVCAAAASGNVQVAAGATTLTINTTAVTGTSDIGCLNYNVNGITGPTNISLLVPPYVSAISALSSFTLTFPVAPVANPVNIGYCIIH